MMVGLYLLLSIAMGLVIWTKYRYIAIGFFIATLILAFIWLAHHSTDVLPIQL